MNSQLTMMTSQLCSTRLPWRDRSAVVGLSTLLFLIPASKRGMPRWKRYSFVVQALLALLSDYVYAGRRHVSHGLDRWCATLNVLACAPRALAAGCAMLPMVCYALSMEAIRLQHRAGYEFWHTMWHITGAACLWV